MLILLLKYLLFIYVCYIKVIFIYLLLLFYSMIVNFKKENISSCTYNFCLGKIFIYDKSSDIIDLEKGILPKLKEVSLPYILKPNEYILGQTIEEFDTPLDLMSIYAMRSTAFRMGLDILCGLNDPGYKGNAIFGIKNISQNKIKIFYRMELLKTAFIELKGNAKPIETKFMGGKLL